jgi:isocitrate dehydrogenase
LVKKVALIEGDGTGPELVDAMLRVLKSTGTGVEMIRCEAGADWWQTHGGSSFIPDQTWDILKKVDACFKGPTTTLPIPGTPRSVAVSIRQHFELYANVRPVKTLPGVGSKADVDFLCVREATEGMYSGLEHKLSDEVSIAIRKITRHSCERVARYAFEAAKERSWSKVIAISKANILKITDGMFLDACRDVAKNYPGISLEDYFIDNFAQQLVKNPERFNQNVILSTNLFMDVISEEASGLIGSIGAVYSANIGEKYAMFEPAHGSAPKYRGMNKVNPTATILAGAWMLKYLGEVSEGDAVFEATFEVIRQGKYVTYDLGGSATTSEMAEAIARIVKS